MDPESGQRTRTLALDVDGVILDPHRHGAGDWATELEARFGITRAQLRATFFAGAWEDVINGRQPIEPTLADALIEIGSDAAVEDVLACWFASDFAVIDATVELAQAAHRAGRRVVLATNQEHRRAAYLREHLGELFDIDDVLYSADLGTQKHDVRFFELAGERIASDAADIAFVDDVANNVDVARSAGWQAVHAPPGDHWQPEAAALLGL